MSQEQLDVEPTITDEDRERILERLSIAADTDATMPLVSTRPLPRPDRG